MRPLGGSPGRWRQLGPPLPLIWGRLSPSSRTRSGGRAGLPDTGLLPEVGAGAGAGRGHVLVHDDHEEESENRRQQPLVEPFIHGPALKPAGEVAVAAAAEARLGACSEVSGTPERGSEPAAPPCPCRRRARLAGCPAALRGLRSRGLRAEPGRRAPAAAWGFSRSPGRLARAGSSCAGTRRSQATRSIPPPAGRRSGAGARGSGPGPPPGCCRRWRAPGLHEARQGTGQGQRRGRAPQPQSSVCTAPRTFPSGSSGARSPLQVCKAAPRRRRERRLCGAASRANRTTAPGPPAQAGAGNAHTLAHAGWHRHNPPAGVTGALLPAAKNLP